MRAFSQRYLAHLKLVCANNELFKSVKEDARIQRTTKNLKTIWSYMVDRRFSKCARLCFIHGGAEISQWEERSPSISVARVRFRPGATCGLGLLLFPSMLRGFSGFPRSKKTNSLSSNSTRIEDLHEN